jgi:hypothetical protein
VVAAKTRDVNHSAPALKLISKGFNVGSKVSLDHGLGFRVIVITVSGPIIRPSSVGQFLFRETDSLTAVIEVGLQ